MREHAEVYITPPTFNAVTFVADLLKLADKETDTQHTSV